MRELQMLRTRPAAWLLLALAACALCAGAAAQSGRRRAPQQSPAPQPSPEAESKTRPAEAKAPAALASFVVLELDDMAYGADSLLRREVVEGFASRLGRSPVVSVTRGGRASRGEARDRAKSETAAFVAVVSLEEAHGVGNPYPRDNTTQDRYRSLAVRTYVYEPKTGALKYTDTFYQRPVRATVGVGGIGLPIPGRTMGRYPSQLELRQAAHDAADRLLSRFKIAAPPEQL